MKLAESMCQRFFEGKAHGIIHGEPKMRSNDLFGEGAEIKIYAHSKSHGGRKPLSPS